MVVRRLGVMEEITCASPAYLATNGVPIAPDSPGGHVMVGFVSSRTGQVLPLEFTQEGSAVEVALPARLLVSGADSSVAAARLGFWADSGTTIPLRRRSRLRHPRGGARCLSAVTDAGLDPVSDNSRQLSPRVRVFVDWLVEVLAPQMRPT